MTKSQANEKHPELLARFVGMWKLIGSEFRKDSGEVYYPLGRKATGLLMYAVDGTMAAQLMRADRPHFPDGDLARGSAEDIRRTLIGYTAYFGTFSINANRQTITHHVLGSLYPDWIGTQQLRHFEFNGNRLTLKTPPMRISGQTHSGVLEWERGAPR
jgi:hypothetical protein